MGVCVSRRRGGERGGAVLATAGLCAGVRGVWGYAQGEEKFGAMGICMYVLR